MVYVIFLIWMGNLQLPDNYITSLVLKLSIATSPNEKKMAAYSAQRI